MNSNSCNEDLDSPLCFLHIFTPFFECILLCIAAGGREGFDVGNRARSKSSAKPPRAHACMSMWGKAAAVVGVGGREAPHPPQRLTSLAPRPRNQPHIHKRSTEMRSLLMRSSWRWVSHCILVFYIII